MATKSINPYRKAETISKTALDFIITNLPPDPTFDNLNDILGGAIFTPDPANPGFNDAANLFLGAVLPFAYNGYVNGGIGNYVKYTDNQVIIINNMLNGIKAVPVENIGDFIDEIDDQIAASKLTCEEQGPLFLSAACAKANFDYWWQQIDNPGSSLWATYLNTDKAINYLHIAGWVDASVQGVLLTYGIVKPPQIQILDIFSSVVGSIGLAAGKVVFGWNGGNVTM